MATRSVKEQGKRAEQLQEQYIQDRQESRQPPAPAGEGTPPKTDEPPPKQNEPPKGSGEGEGDPPKPDREQDAGYWRNRFSVMEGKYRAEVPRLQQQLNEASQRIKTLETELQERSRQKPPGDDPSLSDGELFTEEERNEYGELCPMIERVAQRIAQREASESVKPVRETVQQQHQESRSERVARFWADLRDEVSDWDSINESKEFEQYLLQTDPFSGRTRNELLQDAQQQLDVHRVIRFFKDFKSQQGVPERPNPQEDITPRSRSTARADSGTPPGKRWTRQEIHEHYAAVQRGRFRGREADQRAIDEDIAAAYREGRIID